MKLDFSVDRLAGDLVAFVDNLRALGATKEHAWQVAMQISNLLQYLGIQNAARKMRPPTLLPGAWAGAVFRVYLHEITKTVTQEKWDKAKEQIAELDKVLGPEFDEIFCLIRNSLRELAGFCAIWE
jgi:hypothetical protein